MIAYGLIVAPITALQTLNLLQAKRRDLSGGELIIFLWGVLRGILRRKTSELGLMHKFEMLWVVVFTRLTVLILVEWAHALVILVEIDMHLSNIQRLIVSCLLMKSVLPTAHNFAADESRQGFFVMREVLFSLVGEA